MQLVNGASCAPDSFKCLKMSAMSGEYISRFLNAGPGSKEATSAAGFDRRAPAQTGQGPPACI